MEQAQEPQEFTPRRSAARLRLATDGHFVGLATRQGVTLLDLSQTGVRFALSQPCDEAGGFIQWLDFETFGDFVWQEGLYVGMAFDEPICEQWVLETRNRCQHIDQVRHQQVLDAARSWVGAA